MPYTESASSRQQLAQLVDELKRLSESQLPPPEFFREYMQRVLAVLSAPAGAVWVGKGGDTLQLQHQINLDEVGFNLSENGAVCHKLLLAQAAQQGRPILVPPRSGPDVTDGRAAPANVTSHTLLLTPILLEKQVVGMLEVCQDPERDPDMVRGQVQYMPRLADFAGDYLRNFQLRQMLGQQQVWTQLESFARQIHSSLNPREVAYWVVNDGRQLVECDRLSVAIRRGSYTAIEAISGADVVEKRSRLVKAMRQLFATVLNWGEKLVYMGARDDSLPPDVLGALDDYLAESTSKLLIVMPLRDEREKDKPKKCRSALMVECFETALSVDQLAGRLEVVARHAAPALYNSAEYRRIPLRWLWSPLANVKDGLRGKPLAITGVVIACLLGIILALATIPITFRLDGKGRLEPKEMRVVWMPVPGEIVDTRVRPGEAVVRNQELLIYRDLEAEQRVVKLKNEINSAKAALSLLEKQYREAKEDRERATLALERSKRAGELNKLEIALNGELARDRNPGQAAIRSPIEGTVLTFVDALDNLNGKTVKPGDELLRVANPKGAWEIRLNIPAANIGPIREALAQAPDKRLEVDLLFASHPDRKGLKGYLYPEGLNGETTVVNNEVVLPARIELDKNIDLDEMKAKTVGLEVRAKIHCGTRSVGYVWFHELWEFFYEHVLF